MNGIPLYSTFTLGTETLITICIFYVFYRAYFYNTFPHILAGIVLGYEILFNISYMVSRVVTHVDSTAPPHSGFHIAVAIFHGSFALLMFVLLLMYMFFAWRAYDKGINYFELHKKLTIAFLIAWMIAILSGFLFYYEAYLDPGEILTRQELGSVRS